MKRGLIFLSVLLLIFSYFGFLNGVYSFFQKGFLGIEGFSYRIFQGLPIVSESARVKKLEQENLLLRSQISAIDRLKKENQALLDQFQTQELKTALLLPTHILGAPGFVPGISLPLTTAILSEILVPFRSLFSSPLSFELRWYALPTFIFKSSAVLCPITRP